VIAEVNDQVPDVGGDRRLSLGEIDVLVPHLAAARRVSG